MWQRISLTLLLVASMARSSSSINDEESTTKCPKTCECITIIQPSHSIINNNNNKSIEVRCNGGPLPRMMYLSARTKRLWVEATNPNEIKKMLLDIENSAHIALDSLAIVNCSLTNLNVTLGRVSKGLEVPMSLNLSDNALTNIRQLRISDGKRLGTLDLSKNRLSSLTNAAFVEYPELTELNLRGNAIQNIVGDGFAGLGRLEILDLSDNRLGSIAEDAFVPLCFLIRLNLSGNKLGTLGDQLFVKLGRLRELDVSGNRPSNRSNEDQQLNQQDTKMDVKLSLVLGSVPRLEIVDASRIGIDRVPSALTRSVRTLTLAGNGIKTIRSGDFDSYPLLRYLDLSYNVISIVEDDALGRLENLKELDLSGNRLIAIPQSLPNNLVNLAIRENFIEKLTSKDLQGLEKLESLEVNRNAIKDIEIGTMMQLSLVRIIDISDNPIEQLPANTFGGPADLAVLRMSGLTSLQWEREKPADMAFPVPAPERLVDLDLSRSPALAAQLLADEAALSACKSLRILNIASDELTDLRSDLPYLLPQLRILGLSDNRWNCTNDNYEQISWLARWINEHEEIGPFAECTRSNDRKILLADLPIMDYHSKSSTTTTTKTPPTTTTTKSSTSLSKGQIVIKDDYEITLVAAASSSPGNSSDDDGTITAAAANIGDHPGMLILAGAAIGVLAVAFSIALSQRRFKRSFEKCGTSLLPNQESYNQQQPIVTELW